MNFLRSHFFKNEPLISCPFLSSKLDSPLIKTLERHSNFLKNPYFSQKKMFFDTYQRNIGGQTHTVHMTSGSSIIQSIQDLKYENNLGFPQKNIRDFAFISLKVWHWLWVSSFQNFQIFCNEFEPVIWQERQIMKLIWIISLATQIC